MYGVLRRRTRRTKRRKQHRDQQRALHQVLGRRRGVLQVGAPVGEIGDREKHRLDGDAAYRVADGQRRETEGRRGHRRDQPRQRRDAAQQDGADQRPAQLRAGGDVVGQLGQPGAGDADHRRARGEDHDDCPKRKGGEIDDHRGGRGRSSGTRTQGRRPVPTQTCLKLRTRERFRSGLGIDDSAISYLGCRRVRFAGAYWNQRGDGSVRRYPRLGRRTSRDNDNARFPGPAPPDGFTDRAIPERDSEESMEEKRALLQKEIPRLRRYARVLTKDSDDADDLVQDCLLRALDNLDRWQAGTNMRAWLFTIMHRLFLNSTRRKQMVSVEDLEPSQGIQTTPSSQEDCVRLAEVEQAFAKLSKDHREIILLVAVERLHYEEAADVLNIAVGTVRSRLFRAREALEKTMGQAEISALASAARSPELAPREKHRQH